jgi:diguanylate cyclase (GGDEF)-like protein
VRLFSLDPQTKLRLRATAFGASDAVLNSVILLCFAAVGTIPYLVPLIVLSIAVVMNAVFMLLIGTGISKRWSDPSLTGVQIFAGCSTTLLAILLAPQIVCMFLLNLFVMLSFGSLYFSRRAFFLTWLLLSVCLGICLWIVRDRLDIKVSNTAEWVLLWIVVVLSLARFANINTRISRLRTSLSEKNKALATLAARDDLTGLWNRRKFMELLHEEIERANRTGCSITVAIIDVDHFKRVNDTFGHLTGDAVLKEIGRILNESCRTVDAVGRYGGEEFTILLVDTAMEQAVVALERMRKLVEHHDWSRVSPDLHATVSIGTVEWEAALSLPLLLGKADAALYQAKAEGRNQLRVA